MQLTEQIKRAVAVGALAPGERLPTVKSLAQDLKINANTVARVYRELERDGIIDTAPGRGSFVRENGTVAQARHVLGDAAARVVDDAVREARSLGVAKDEIKTIADAAIARWYPEDKS